MLGDMAKALTRTERQEAVVKSLSEREGYAYRVFAASGANELAPEGAKACFELFLIGKTCDDIQKAYPEYGFGQVVHARVRDEWDARKVEQLERLKNEVPVQAGMAQLQSVDFLSKMLRAMHLSFSDELDLFLATGDKAHLKGTPLETFTMKQYQQVLELMIRATGQEQKKTVVVQGGITVSKASVSVEEHANILDVLVEETAPKQLPEKKRE